MAGINISLIAMAIALKTISSIGDYGQVWSSVGAIGAVLIAFLGFIFLLNKIAATGISGIIKTDKILMFSVALLALSAGLIAFSNGIRSITNINKGSLLLFSAVLAGLLSFSYLLKKLKPEGLIKFGFALIPLGMGLSVLAVALSLFGNVSWAAAIKGVFVLVSSLTILGVVTKYLVKTEKSIKRMTVIAASLIILAASIAAIALALQLFNNVSWAALGKGMLTVFASLLMLGVMVKYFATTKKSTERMMLIGIALIVLAGAIAAFALALQLFNMVSWSSIGKGAAVVAGGFLLLGLAAVILKPIIGTVFLLSASMLMLGLGLITAAIALGLFAASLPTFTQALIDNVALIGVALVTIGPVLVSAIIDGFTLLLNSMSELIPSIVLLVTELINALVVILTESAGPLIVAIVGLIDKLLAALVANSKSIFDSVFTLIDAFLDALLADAKNIAKKLVDILIKIIKGITEKVPELVASLIDLLIVLVNALFDNIGPLITVMTKRIFEFLTMVIELFAAESIKFATTLTKIVLVLIATVIQMVINSLGTLSKLFIDLVGGILLILTYTFIGLTDVLYETLRTILYNIFYVLFKILGNLPSDLKNLLGGALGALLGAIAKMLGSLVNKYLGGLFGLGDLLYDMGETMATAANNGLSDNILKGSNVTTAIKTARKNISGVMTEVMGFIKDDVTSGVKALSDAANDSLKLLGSSVNKDAKSAGEQLGDGFNSGMYGSSDEVEKAGKDLGNSAILGVKKAADINSPSKVMEQMGKYFVAGLSNGITDNASKAKDSVLGLMNEALSGIESVLDSDMDTEFSIRPVMDLSGVSAGAANISSLMSSINGGNVSVSGQLAASVAKKTTTKSGSLESQSGQTINNGGDVFNATFNVTADNPEAVANEVNVRLQKLRLQAKQAKGGVY